MLKSTRLAVLALLAQATWGLKPADLGNGMIKDTRVKHLTQSDTIKEYNFSVPADHFHDKPQYEPHSNEFFPLRYFLEPSYYKPGGPVIVISSGETAATARIPYMQNGIGSVLGKATGGMVVGLEHRFYGTSGPVSPLNPSVQDYRLLTTEQATADTAYFAKHVKFPGFEDYNLTAPNTPWIIYGGSYAGAFAAFTRKTYPDAYWGAISSSGVTAAKYDFWEYNEATRLFAPGDCGTLMGKMTHVVDTALLSGNETKVDTIKQFFGYFGTIGNADFGSGVAHPQYALQSQSWVHGQGDTKLETYCATLQSKTLQYPELEKNRAVAEQLVKDAGYSQDAATRLLNYAGLVNPANPPSNQKRQYQYEFDEYSSWFWQKCTQWGYFVSGDGVPEDTLGILSRAVTVNHVASICERYFNITTPPDVKAINQFGGYNFSYPRVAIVDGKQDPWRAATPHKIGINEDRKSTTSEPYLLIDYATHHWDEDDVPESEYKPGYPPKQIVEIHEKEVAFVKAWLEEFNKTRAAH